MAAQPTHPLKYHKRDGTGAPGNGGNLAQLHTEMMRTFEVFRGYGKRLC